MEIAIVGGGIAGLSTAVACHLHGIDAQVFEAAPEFKPLGTSLSLWPNAMRVLTQWGLKSAITSRGAMIEQVAWRRLDGRSYFEQPLNALYAKLGYEGYCVRRSDLHAALLSAIPLHCLHKGHRLVDITKGVEGVDLTFDNGVCIKAKHVIAADGLWSVLRQRVVGQSAARYSGYGAWLGLSSVDAPTCTRNEACEYLGANARLGVLETGQDTRYWFLVANRETPTERAMTVAWDEIASLMKEWPERLRDLVLDSTITSPTFVSFYDRPVSPIWGDERITLIGDAMHPFVPNLGQGACQAIEDSFVIAEGLRKGLIGAALSNWMRDQRLSRVRYMRRTANQLGKLGQSRSPLARTVLTFLGTPPFQAKLKYDLERQFTFHGTGAA